MRFNWKYYRAFQQNENESPWHAIRDFIRRPVTEKNQNFIGLFLGRQGSGKSLATLWLAEELDSTFTHERVCFDIPSLFKWLLPENREKLPTGAVIVLEELGVSHNKQDFNTSDAKSFSKLIQYFRAYNLILLANAPQIKDIVKSTRTHLQAVFETQGVIEDERACLIRVTFFNTNPITGDTYNNKMQFSWLNGATTTVDMFKSHLPSRHIRTQYEKSKQQFMDNTTVLAYKRMSGTGEKRVVVTERERSVLERLQSGMIPSEIKIELNASLASVKQTMDNLSRKGLWNKEKNKIRRPRAAEAPIPGKALNTSSPAEDNTSIADLLGIPQDAC